MQYKVVFAKSHFEVFTSLSDLVDSDRHTNAVRVFCRRFLKPGLGYHLFNSKGLENLNEFVMTPDHVAHYLVFVEDDNGVLAVVPCSVRLVGDSDFPEV